ncbi:amino acid adenylation domain protein [Collimonas fungivorans]|uniref:Amino acid adenylation domain protein n=1 Tax=Collimonas fungivorans TaxID=158899 RepID=A0A127P608_9BURK|nr:non-ribosomal peptide synthetase [Collimonas fungivorans]AMO93246.1 amino acid adenylation domain protein [Collimonas fungivorans]
MTIYTLLSQLETKGISLALKGEEIVVRGDKKALADETLLNMLRQRKPELIAYLGKEGYIGKFAGNSVTPSNQIPPYATDIRPEMLTLVSLKQEEIDRIASQVEGGCANIQDIYPLAPLQEGILFHHLLQQQGEAYVTPTLLAFDSRERLDRFVQTLNHVVARHDILRTAVVWEGLDEPVQVVWRRARFELEVLDFSEGDVQAQLLAHADPRHYHLDVRQAPMMRGFAASDPTGQRWLLQFMFHHLVMDHTTLELLIGEIALIQQGREVELPPAVPFRNFVAQARLGVSKAEHEAFFREMLGDVDEPTTPFGLQDIQGDGSLIREARLEVAPDLARRLRRQARQRGVSAASVFHLAFAQVLAKSTGRDDVVFGTVLFGRMQGGAGADRAMGMFINTLPLRVRLGEQSVFQCVQATHKGLIGLLHHEHASLTLAQRCSALSGTAPLFSALLNYRYSGQPTNGDATNAFEGMRVLGGEERTNYPLTLSIDDLGEGFWLTAQIVETIGADRICQFVHKTLQQLVDALEHSAESPIRTLQVLPDAERAMVLQGFNDTACPYPKGAMIHELFEQQAQARPDAIALEFEDQKLSYGELNAKANQLARHLIELGVKPDARVALCLERSLEMVIAILATLKAGGAYVPLDPAYPVERLAHMVEGSEPVVLITQAAVQAKLSATAVFSDFAPVVLIDAQPCDQSLWAHESPQNLAPCSLGLNASNLAYVIYTSGSTGQPKGVMIEHHQVINLWVALEQAIYRHHPAENVQRISLNASISFDVAVQQWVQLLSGRTLVLVPNAMRYDGAALRDWIKGSCLDVLDCTPTQIKIAIEDTRDYSILDSQRPYVALVGGETMGPSLWAQFGNSKTTTFYNVYGPTECTVVSTVGCVHAGDASPHLGRPIANTKVYILDGYQQPVPIGVAGEMYIGGVGVARGYLNRPDLTAERFISDPFSKEPAARLYKTGDLARWREDGAIEFLGRNDHQVKIRGFRIELGEIEAQLARLPGIREVVVVAREDIAGDKRLVAYVVASQEQGQEQMLDVAALRDALALELPHYMVPAAFVQLKALPLTPNGKLDRKALPVPEGEAFVQRVYEAPVGEIEQMLASIWSELLKIEQVGRHDNFFELGGHSLLAVTLIERIRQRGLTLAVRSLFEHPSLMEQAHAVSAGQVQGLPELAVPTNGIAQDCTHIRPEMLTLVSLKQEEIDRIASQVEGGCANIQDIYPLAPLQEGILFHHLLQQQGEAYVTPTLLAFDSRERLDRFVQTLNHVVARHDILRTAVVWEGLDEPVQVVWRRARFELEVLDFSEGDVQAQLLAHADPRHYHLDVRQAPMMRGFAASDPTGQRWLLQFMFHHLVMDHTTLELLIGEIALIQQGREVELPPAVPFRNFVAQARLGVSKAEHEAFFREMLGDVDEPTTPFGLQDIQGDGSLIREARLEVAPDLARRLRRQARQRGVSAASVFHLAFAQVLAKSTGRDDVVFGTVLFGRMQGGAGADRAMGMFINTLPLRVRLGEQSVFQCVQATHKGLIGLLHHEHASLTLAQRCSALSGTAPLFSALLNYRYSGQPTNGDATNAFEGMRVLGGEERTNYPLTLSIDDLGEGFWLTAQIVETIGADRICQFVHKTLQQLVDALEHSAESPIRTLQVLPDAERAMVLQGFNDTACPYPKGAMIHELFEQQAQARPDAIALEFEDQKLSYGELNAKANQLARHLRELGVTSEVLVGVYVERSLEMVIAILATLKAGGAYLPLDPNYPAERLKYMLFDANPKVVLTQNRLLTQLPVYDAQILCLDSHWQEQIAAQSVDNLVCLTQPCNSAFVIYTSGSTGQPKGVVNTVEGLGNRLWWFGRKFAAVGILRTALKTSIGFVDSVTEVLGTLLYAGQLIIFPQETLLDPELLGASVHEYEINHIVLVPSLLRHVLQADARLFQSIKLVISSGEYLPKELIDQVHRKWPHACLMNFYGSAEVNGDATFNECLPGTHATSSSIGKPIANTKVYILDGYQQPVPIGVAGEMYIGGVGVARGYLNRPDLTAERFISDPFSKEPAARLYKTGDLARWREDGAIEFLGRNDHQVKIRGFRIELGEIEAQLARLPGIREVVVVAREDIAGDKRLVAYVVASQEQGQEQMLDVAALRDALALELPHYMVPAAFVQLKALPLTPNGKLHRKALPAPDIGDATRGYVAPRTPVEIQLTHIFADLLGLELNQIGIYESFFDLGGHSLLAARLVTLIDRNLGVQISIRTIFEAHSVADLAARIAEGSALEDIFAPLLTLRAGGNQPALFCIHPGTGLSWQYAGFSRHIRADRPIYGLQASMIADATMEMPRSVGELAEEYIRIIRQTQPSGPYHLIGWSFGGLVAFEVAIRLQAEQVEVGLIALIDSFPSRATVDSTLPNIEQLTYVFREAGMDATLLSDSHLTQTHRFLANVLEISRFVPSGVLSGNILFFRARDAELDENVWRPFTNGQIARHEIDADHHFMMRPQPIKEIADVINSSISNIGTQVKP